MPTTNQEVVDKIIANLRILVRTESAVAVQKLQTDIERAIEKAGKDLKKNLTSSSAQKPAKEA